MPTLETRDFGAVDYQADAVIQFPAGLPGFEERRRFVTVQQPHTAPLVFLQSLEEPSLCFPALPARVVDPRYVLRLSEADRELLQLERYGEEPAGEQVLCLAVLSFRETGPTANLLAPVVVNLANRLAVQSLQQESSYSHRHSLFPGEAETCL
jgi:flagellar assembly factor FliW